ncbi:hypothetical protein BD289DRAFT_429063 [Coniella lustricola]|uniref:Uncharacterized protein n=1 Tax=Coniella lustricola TaxID=2025994 RepID=A0A2T3AD81_9PEZI|nr:hypothetical protein BD289DRAFT_429063 [Coniella lustricola]
MDAVSVYFWAVWRLGWCEHWTQQWQNPHSCFSALESPSLFSKTLLKRATNLQLAIYFLRHRNYVTPEVTYDEADRLLVFLGILEGSRRIL